MDVISKGQKKDNTTWMYKTKTDLLTFIKIKIDRYVLVMYHSVRINQNDLI
jgi:hypothetical protein